MIFLLIYIIFTTAFMHGFVGCLRGDAIKEDNLTNGQHFKLVFFSIFTFPFLIGGWFYNYYKDK